MACTMATWRRGVRSPRKRSTTPRMVASSPSFSSPMRAGRDSRHTAGEVLEQVADRDQPKGGQALGYRRLELGGVRQRAQERCGVNREWRGLRPSLVPAAAELQGELSLTHSTIIPKADVPGPMCVPTTAPIRPVMTIWRPGARRADRRAASRARPARPWRRQKQKVVGRAVLAQVVDHRRLRTPRAASLRVRGHLAVGHLDDRVMPSSPPITDRGPDAAAAAQVLERAGMDDRVAVLRERVDVRARLVAADPGRQARAQPVDEHGDRRGDDLRIDHLDVCERAGGCLGRPYVPLILPEM